MSALEKHHGLTIPRTDDYIKLLERVSRLIEQSRKTAVRQINTVLVANSWLTGQQIVEHEQKGKLRAEYGVALMERLGSDLVPRYGRGFSARNLKLMRQFYIVYPIRQTLSAESGMSTQSAMESIAKEFPLSWSHYSLLVRIDDPLKRVFYENLSVQNDWVVRQLDREIQAMLYERTALSKRKELVLAKANKDTIALKPEDEVKSSYILDFLGLKNEYSELDLENALIRHLENFLLELGRGFAFVARQKRFVLDGDEFRIDLLLFHISLRAYFVLELKLGKFSHAHAGQINFYVNWVKENVLPRAENGPFGIILCSDKNNTTVKYATGGLSNKIFVSKYQIKLPGPEELKKELERGCQLFFENQIHQKGGV